MLLNVLVACQKNKQTKPNATHKSWHQVKSWTLKGKMAINDGQNSGSGTFKWLMTGANTNARFKAPFGQGSWNIQETEISATLTSSKNGNTVADSAEELISNELGWHFPWNNLKYWLRGYKSNPNLPTSKTMPQSFQDDGWTISYQKWMPTPMGLLPKKIYASKPPYSVKLIIYSWSIE